MTGYVAVASRPMSVPKRLLQVMDLARALAQKNGRIPSALRIEIPEDLLHPVPAEVVAPLLAEAIFLAPIIHALPSPYLSGVERSARQHDLWLDLSVRLPAKADHLTRGLLERTARLHIQVMPGTTPSAAASVLAALAPQVQGQLELSVAVTTESAADLLAWVELVGAAKNSAAIHFVPHSESAGWTLRGARQDLGAAAHQCGIGLELPDGFRLSARRAPDALAPWNILHQCSRSLFALHPELCPFPFLMLRVTANGAFGACPVSTGPPLPRGPNAFAGEVADSLRAAWLAGKPPPTCQQCTLKLRVRESLAEDLKHLPAELRKDR
jgi:hypothetical protein